MRKKALASFVIGISAGLCIVAPAQAVTVYTINQTSTVPEVGGELSPLSDTVSGTISTNGTIGALQSGDILGYDLQLTDNIRPNYSVELTPSNSGIYLDVGNGLTAGASGLAFNFSLPGAIFIIQGTTHGFGSGYEYFCFQATTGPCLSGETIVPYYYSVDGVSAQGLTGTLPLDPVSPVPEPSTFAVLSLGLAGFLARRQNMRRTTT